MIDWNKFDKKVVDNIFEYKRNIEDLSDKEILTLINNIMSDCEKYNVDSQEYFLYDFENISDEIKQTYIDTKTYRKTVSNCISRLYLDDFKNKYNTYLKFKDFYRREAVRVEGFRDYEAFSDFLSRHKKYIIKVIDGSLGSKVSVINVNENDSPKDLFFFALSYGGCIIEEFVKQDPRFEQFNKTSVNTVRLTTICDNENVRFFFSLARFGKDGAVVDNGGQGGIISMVDIATGTIISDGFDESLNKYVYHPNSGIKIKGFQIPRWEELLSIASDLAQKSKGMTVIGWDFALTDKGWVIIEANTNPSIFPIQMLTTKVYGKGMKEEYTREIGKYQNHKRVDY